MERDEYFITLSVKPPILIDIPFNKYKLYSSKSSKGTIIWNAPSG